MYEYIPPGKVTFLACQTCLPQGVRSGLLTSIFKSKITQWVGTAHFIKNDEERSNSQQQL